MGDQWESLPEDIFVLVIEKIPTLEDSIRVCFVCKSWRSMSDSAILHIMEKKKLPLLIVPYDHRGGGGGGGGDFKKERKLLGSSNIVCDDTLGFISLFDDEDDQLNKKKKKGCNDDDDDQLNKKKNKGVYKLYLPEIADRRICGSSEGWLITIHKNGEIQLLNPITRVLVHLPPLSTAFPRFVFKLYFEKEKENYCYRFLANRLFRVYDSYHYREFFLVKVVTNSTTNSTTTTTVGGVPTVVMAIYGRDRRLAFCRPGNGIDDDEQQNKWICCLEGNNIQNVTYYKGNFYEVNGYEDVTYYKGNFYAVHLNGHVDVVKDLDGPSPFVETIIEQPEYCHRSYMNNYSCVNYLVVDSSFSSTGGGGDLLMVIRDVGFKGKDGEENYKQLPYITFGFRVWKLDFNGEGPSWEKVINLGEDCALFVGYNNSFSFSASKFPGCRGNCIYFTDNNWELVYEKRYGGHDMGVYYLEDGSFEHLNYETTNGSSKLFMPPPIWYVPNSIIDHRSS